MSAQKGKFFLQFDDDASDQQKHQQRDYKELNNQQQKKNDDDRDKYIGNKIGKGYFNQNDQEGYVQVTSPPKKSIVIQQIQSMSDSVHKRRSKRNQKLKPLPSNAKIQSKQISLPNEKEKKSAQRQNIFDEDLQDIQQIKLQNQQKVKMIDKRSNDFAFQINQVKQNNQQISQTKSDQNQNQEELLQQIDAKKDKKSRPHNIQIANKINQQHISGQSDQNSPARLANNKNPSSFQIKQFIIKQLPLQRTVRLTLVREKGLFQIHPIYSIHTTHDNRYLMSAKKISNSLIATHHLSMNPNDMQQNGPAYVGKVKSSLTGTIHNIFGPGLSPQNAKGNNGPQRQVIATVSYLTQLFSGGSKPRELRVYIKKPDVSYFQLTGVTPYQQQVSLQDLYPLNKNKILIFRNRKPVWKQQIKGYSLNFRGRVSQPSIKNFILETNTQQPQGQQVLLFGRVGDDRFNMDVSHPLSLSIAMGIVLTSFGSA